MILQYEGLSAINNINIMILQYEGLSAINKHQIS